MPSFEESLSAKELSPPAPAGAVENPFGDLKITDFSFLDSISDRSVCPICSKRRKFFCYCCFVPMPELGDKIPRVSLPLRLEVVKHPKEVEGKSTAVHAAVVANSDTTVRTWPDIPDYDANTTLLVFPCDTSVSLAQLAGDLKIKEEEEEEGVKVKKRAKYSMPYDTIVFIESTWNQAHSIFIDERLQKLKRIQLQDYETHFWRYQRGKPTTFLSTIEAIYWFFVEFDKNFPDSESPRCFDDLLFFFAYMHSKIFKMYDGRLKVTEERRQRLAERQKEEAKEKKKKRNTEGSGESNDSAASLISSVADTANGSTSAFAENE